MLKISETVILLAEKYFLLFIQFWMKLFPIAMVSLLCIWGFNFHTLWLQVEEPFTWQVTIFVSSKVPFAKLRPKYS